MSEFIPEPYCNTRTALCYVYRSLYPEAQNDHELLASLERRIVALRAEAVEIAQEIASYPASPETQTPIRMGHIELTPAMVSGMRNDLVDRRKDKLKTAAQLSKFRAQLSQGSRLHPFALLSLRAEPIGNVLQKDIGSQPVLYGRAPSELLGLAKRRWPKVTSALRTKLCAGDVTAYKASAESGMVQFQNANYWLIDGPSEKALRSGEAECSNGWSPVKVTLRFDKDELVKHFPELESDGQDTLSTEKGSKSAAPIGRPNERNELAAWIKTTWPEGTSPTWTPEAYQTIGEWRNAASSMRGTDIKAGLFIAARKIAYGGD